MERKLRGSDSLEEAAAELNLCDVLRCQCFETDVSTADGKRKFQEAEASIRACLAIRRKRLGDVNNDVAWALDALSILFRDSSPRRLDEAEAACRESVAIRQKLYGDDHPDLASSYCYLASVLGVKNNLAEAETCYRKALSIERKSKGQDTWWYASYLYGLSPLLQKEGKLDEAETCWRDAVSIARKQMGEDNPLLGEGMLQLAQLLRNKREFVEARNLPRMPWPCIDAFQAVRFNCRAAWPDLRTSSIKARSMPLPNQWPASAWKSAKRIFPTIGVLSIPAICWCSALLGQKKYADAEPLLLSGYEGLKLRETMISPGGKVHLKEAIQRLVKLYEATDKADKAARWKEKLAEFETPKTKL